MLVLSFITTSWVDVPVSFCNQEVFLTFVEGSRALHIQFRIQCFLCREGSSIGLACSDYVVSNNIQYADDTCPRIGGPVTMIRVLG